MELKAIQQKLDLVRGEIAKVVVGLDDVMDTLLVALLSNGHVLLEGSPGVGKTTLAKTFAQAIGGDFKRIQMTPDLLPADLLGINVYNPEEDIWRLKMGPIFANIILADELNRASPKVQSAFLEAMQEQQVTLEGETLLLNRPFMVIATQQSYGEVGTYPLTNVQMDRFAYKVSLGYPGREDELEIISRIDSIENANTEPVLESREVVNLAEHACSIYVHQRVKEYIIDLVTRLRKSHHVRTAPSPRASIWLLKGGRVKAMMEGRDYVTPDDVKALAQKVLIHRVKLTPQAEAEEVSVNRLITEALEETPIPKGIEQRIM